MWVYIRSEPDLWTVGFYEPNGQWHAESDYGTTTEAAARVAWLNGGGTEDGWPPDADMVIAQEDN